MLILEFKDNLYLYPNFIKYSRQVTRDRAIEFQKNNKIDAFFETSAKTGTNVEEVFALAAKQLYSIHKRDNTPQKPLDEPPTQDEIKKLEKKKHNSKGEPTKKKGCAC